MRLLITFARSYPWQSAIALICLLAAGLAEGIGLSALLPLLSVATGDFEMADSGVGAIMTDAFAALGLTPTIGGLLIVIVVGITLKNGLMLLAKKQVGYTVAHVATDLRLELVRTLLTTRWEYYLRQRVGSLANAVATEAQRAANAYLCGITMITLCLQAIVYAGVAMLVSWQFTLLALVAGSVLLYLLGFLVRKSRRAGKKQTKLLKSLLARLTDSLQSAKPLKAMAREELADSLLEGETKALNRALQKEVFSKEALAAAQEPMLMILIAVGLYFALVHWSLSLATVMVMVFLLNKALAQLGKVQKQYQRMVAFESAYWSLRKTVQEARHEQEPICGFRAPRLEKSIRLERVSFAYQDQPVLHSLSLTILAGSFTTLVGTSGAGKTTVVDLVTGLIKPQQGEIWIDDVTLKQVDIKRWRRMIGYVPQEIVLLHDSVWRNVTLGDPELTEQDAERALRAAGAWDFVAALPAGMDSTVGERGAKLSGGQRQRIAIARALVHQPKLLILDEATSALDPENAAQVCDTLRRLPGEITILAITHQPALVQAADQVYRLRNGALALEPPLASASSA